MSEFIWLVFFVFLGSCLLVGIRRTFRTGRRLVNKLYDKLDKWIDNSQEAKGN